MARDAVKQDHDTKMAWVYAGPNAGRMLELPLADFERAVENDWAEDPAGKSSLDLKPALIAGNPDADRFARGLDAETASEKKQREADRLRDYGAPAEPVEQANRKPAGTKAAPRPPKPDDEPDPDDDDEEEDDDDDDGGQPAPAPRKGPSSPPNKTADVSSEIVRSKPQTVKAKTDDGQTTTTRTMRATRKV